MVKRRRKQYLIEPHLQFKFALVFMTTAAAVVMAQAVGLFHTLHSLATDLPNDGSIVQMQVPTVLLRSTLLTLGLVVPLSLLVGVLTMFRVVGPIYRFRVFLKQVADGQNPPDCRIRKGDELHDICALLNQATAPLRQGPPAATDAEEDADAEEAVDVVDAEEAVDVAEDEPAALETTEAERDPGSTRVPLESVGAERQD